MYQYNIRIVPDVPVFAKDLSPHMEGRAALRAVLASRVNPDLFEGGQLDRLLVACGGNVRDLFEMIIKARGLALNFSESAARIEESHVSEAIQERQTSYQRLLYDADASDVERTAYKPKLERLAHFHLQKPATERDTVFYALLRARALQEFADARVAVHPLVVDLLFNEGMFAGEDVKTDSRTGRPLGGAI
jgi:hypothetical protein